MKTDANRVVTMGEIMLRLKSPGFERLFQSSVLEATFGGGEANVAASLANFGVDVSFVTKLPQNAIGDACISFLRSRAINPASIARGGDRLGIYFLEAGANQRPSSVVYDRILNRKCQTGRLGLGKSIRWSFLVPHHRDNAGN